MGKVYESQVDPDEFIRSFREEPSQLSALKRKEGTTVTTAEPATEAPANDDNGCQASATVDKEAEYIAKFICAPMFVNTTRHDITVDISADFVGKIKRILSYDPGLRCSMKAYINNVLAEHFKEYEEIIKKRL